MTWWLSFSGDSGYIGAIIVDDLPTGEMAVALVTALGINPGGEIAFMDVQPDDTPEEYRQAFAELPRLKLLTLDQLGAALGPMVKVS